MRILAIETSCDDTCAAVLEARDSRFKLLSNIVSSQVKLHSKYGGVWPSLAKREHQKNLPVILKKALKEAKDAEAAKIDLIAVTNGPGLEPCLWVGVNFAVDLAKKLKLPLIPVNHLEAHILANFINKKPAFPAVCLVVSGGHTQLILMRGFGEYKTIGETRDDAAGECLDKAARILGLGYPGGPAIASEAKLKAKGPRFKVELPRPMIHHQNYDFSFSGLKTAVLYLVKQLTAINKRLTIRQKREVSAEIQQAVIDVLIHKTVKAVRDYKVKSIILGGGVAANRELRKQFNVQSLKMKVNFFVPPENLCTDNAAMVATAAYMKIQKLNIEMRNDKSKFKNWRKIKADSNLRLS